MVVLFNCSSGRLSEIIAPFTLGLFLENLMPESPTAAFYLDPRSSGWSSLCQLVDLSASLPSLCGHVPPYLLTLSFSALGVSSSCLHACVP